MADRDQNRQNQDRTQGERRPWEGYARNRGQAPDFGSAGGQYTSRVGPDQNPYGNDAGAYAGARQGSRDQDEWHNQREQASRGRSQYGQVGGSREQAEDEGGYSRGSRQGGGDSYGQGGYGEERDWGRDRGGHGQVGYGPGNPRDSSQLARGSNSQPPGQAGQQRGQRGSSPRDQHDHDYHHWREDQARQYDEEYGSWRESQLRRHDDDYSNWRKERQDKFGQNFSDWRTQQGANPQGKSTAGDDDTKN